MEGEEEGQKIMSVSIVGVCGGKNRQIKEEGIWGGWEFEGDRRMTSGWGWGKKEDLMQNKGENRGETHE